MVNLKINGTEISAKRGSFILSVCRENGINIPTLCHSDILKPGGHCGLCVAEVSGSRKLLRACGTQVASGMEIHTHSPRVISARKTILEFIISTHSGDCRPPCMSECPAGSDCRSYIAHIAAGNYREAAKVMKDAFPLPASIGRICPHPCEKACRRNLIDEPLSIARLKYSAADNDLFSAEPFIPEPETPAFEPGHEGKSVAVIGGGPAGLTAAYFLRLNGHGVTVYEKMPLTGGLLRYGIPEYRLPKKVLDAELKLIEKIGVKFSNNITIGKDITLDELRERHSAVIAATGAGISRKLGCPGENLENVVGGIDFLCDAACGNPMNTGKHVVVVGGSNTAMDAARTSLRLGAEQVTVVYRRSRDEMPAEPEEIAEAEHEGVVFKFLHNPIEIHGTDFVTSVRLQKTELGEPDASGRRSPRIIPGAEETIRADTVITAIGQMINKSGLETLDTSRPNEDAIGDMTGQTAYAIEAIGQAKKAAAKIHKYLTGETVNFGLPAVLVKDRKTAEDFAHEPKRPRRTNEKAEAERCLSCGCADYHECKLIKYANEYGINPLAYSGADFAKPKTQAVPTGDFLIRDPKKCVLCGLCVRVCEEVEGLSVFSMVDRGFETRAATAHEIPLEETVCNNCGKCAELCPTGALIKRSELDDYNRH